MNGVLDGKDRPFGSWLPEKTSLHPHNQHMEPRDRQTDLPQSHPFSSPQKSKDLLHVLPCVSLEAAKKVRIWSEQLVIGLV